MNEEKRVIEPLSSLSLEQPVKDLPDSIPGQCSDVCGAEQSAEIPFQDPTVDAAEDVVQEISSQAVHCAVLKDDEKDDEKDDGKDDGKEKMVLADNALPTKRKSALRRLEVLPADAMSGITILLIDFGVEMGDSQCQLYTLARSLHEHESTRVIVACPRQSALRALLDNDDIPCYPLASSKGTNPLLLLSLAWLIHKYHIRLLHTQDTESITTGWLLKKFFKEKLVLIHSQNVLQDMPVKKYLQADAIVCLSQTIGVTLAALGIPESKIFTVQSSIDPLDFPVKRAHHAGHYVFLVPGSLVPQKGHTILLQAMVLLDEMDDLPPWEVHCVDAGRLAPELFEEVLEQQCLTHLLMFGNQNWRSFLVGANAVLVLTHEIAKASLAIKEAWAAKVPVICSNNLSNIELVQDKQTGLVLPEGNPVALASLMVRLMTGANLAETVEAGKALVQQEYTHAKRLEALLAVYNKFCEVVQKPE